MPAARAEAWTAAEVYHMGLIVPNEPGTRGLVP